MRYLLLFLMWTSLSIAQVPQYYSSIDFNETPENIKAQLSSLITTTHLIDLPYTSSQLDTWDVVRQTDEVQSSTSDVYLFYGYDNGDGDPKTDYTRDERLSCHVSSCTGLWNREHVYAKSLATPSLETDQPGPGTDVHNLRACDSQMNTSKSNRLFEDGSGNSHITPNGEWYPGDEWKGDVARIIMYMYLRYPSQCSANATAYSSNTSHPDMPDIFLEWNVEDPVSQVELQRNDVLEGVQGNRNPFIDNPYIATMIWGGNAAQDTWNTLSIAEQEKIVAYSIYPNPANDIFYIKSGGEEIIDISLVNLNGQVLINTKNKNSLDITELQDGFYILELTTQNQKKVFKILKN